MNYLPPGGENLNLFEKEIEQKRPPPPTRRGLQPPRRRVKEIFFFKCEGAIGPLQSPGGGLRSRLQGRVFGSPR